MENWYPLGVAQVIQTALVMGFGLLTAATFARRAYTRTGWLLRLLGMMIVFAPLAWLDSVANQGVGSTGYGDGVGTSVHYWVLGITVLVTLGTFLATLRAHRKTQLPYPTA